MNEWLRAKALHLGAAGVVLISGLLLAWQAKILFLLSLMAAGAYALARRGSTAQRIGLTLLPLTAGLLLAWCAAGVVHGGLMAAANLKETVPPPPPTCRAWIGAERPRSAADAAGRYAALLGGLIGLAAGVKLRPKVRHGPGTIRGREVVEGGWATPADLADKCDFGPPTESAGGGVPLGRLQGQIVRLNPNKGKIKIAGHTLIIGPTGVGKSFTCIRNQVVAAVCDGQSVVVADLKGELFEDLSRWLAAEGYEVIGFNVANPARSHRWNPLMECRDFEEMMDMTDWLISAAGDDHAFFSGGEKNVFAAAAGFARWALPEGQNHLRAALSVLSWPQEALDKAYAEAFRAGRVGRDAYETWRVCQGHYDNYVEGVRNKVRALTKGPLAALTADSDFKLEDIGRRKTALFLLLPDGGDLKSLLVPFYAFMFKRLKEAAEITSGGRLPVQVRFILDEFANIGRIPDIDKVCALGRSRGIWVQIAIQNIGQLQGLYSRERAWKAVAGNCPIKICLAADDEESARFFTSAMGEAVVRDVTESRDVSTPWDALEIKRRESTKNVKIMSPWEVMQMPEDDSIVVLRGKRPIYLQKLAWTELPQYPEIAAAGKARAEEVLPEVLQGVQLPPFPAGGETPKDPERTRGGKAKVKTGKLGEVEEEYDPEAAARLGIG
ncbi:MAG: type IV secretory system conjugative DNA transfer family protein [Thermoanaerobacterales bacterium]|nr:type IV secretory system conjugative DNA transfer family protein [Thermoanaerobacterales bacterium]